jgi:protein-disulfide isomerase
VAKDRKDDERDDLDEDEDDREEEGDVEREERDDADDDDDALKPSALEHFDDDEEPKVVKDAAVARAARRGGRSRAGKKKQKALPAPPAERKPAPTRSDDAKSAGGANTWLAALAALAVGGVLGWFAHSARADQTTGAEALPDPAAVATGTAGTGGPCDTWAEKLCAETGAQSEGCGQARAASGILPPSACNEAMANLPATITKLKAARSTCDELVTKICNDLGKDTETCKMVQEKTPQFPTERCKQMLGNYDQVLGELKQMEARNAPLSPELAAEHAKGDRPSFGPDDAPFTVVEYSDFECPYCSQAANAVKALKEKYGDKVRFVFRQYPLPFHKNAQVAAEASLAAHAQGKFWPFHDKLFENQKALTREDLEKYALELGLNMEKFKKALDDKTYEAAVKEDMALGEKVGVSGTPTMMVGVHRVQNPSDVGSISALIDKELAK